MLRVMGYELGARAKGYSAVGLGLGLQGQGARINIGKFCLYSGYLYKQTSSHSLHNHTNASPTCMPSVRQTMPGIASEG